jgi:hypothetical protein
MASANTLTDILEVISNAAQSVTRELVGFIPAVYINSDVEKVAKDQVISYPVVGTATPAPIVPAASPPDGTGNTITNGTMAITRSESVIFPWNGDEQASIRGVYNSVLERQFAQAMRALCNEIEVDLFLAAKRNASRAYGTPGTTPFPTAGNFTDFAETVKMLDDNGTPSGDRHLVLNTTAATKILSVQSSLFKANEAGSDDMLRNGVLGEVEGLQMHKSAKIVSHVKGTGTNYVVNGSHAVGATTLVAKTGSGTVLYGDVLTLEDDTVNKYVVNTGIAAPGSIILGKPGLRQLQTDGKTITVGANYLGNFAFDRNAIHLLTRLPLMPDGGDQAEDSTEVTDLFSGLSFQVNLYRGYHQVEYEVGIAWGTKAVKSDDIVTLLG